MQYRGWRNTARHGMDAGTEEEVEYAAVVDEAIVMMFSETRFWSLNSSAAEQVEHSNLVERIPSRHWLGRSPDQGA